jgi:hypothetical protein
MTVEKIFCNPVASELLPPYFCNIIVFRNESSTLTWQGRLHWNTRFCIVYHTLPASSRTCTRIIRSDAPLASRADLAGLHFYIDQWDSCLLRYPQPSFIAAPDIALGRISRLLNVAYLRRKASCIYVAGVCRLRVADHRSFDQPLHLPDRATLEESFLITYRTRLQNGLNRACEVFSVPTHIRRLFFLDWP